MNDERLPELFEEASALHPDERRRFLDRHLGAWVGPFAAAVRAGAQTDFYRALAALTERFVGLESSA